MTRHTHRYRFPVVVLLTLPDTHGYADCFLSWQCLTCPYRCHATGLVHERSRNLTVEAWEAQVDRERRAGGVLAQAAEREERIKVR